MDFHHHENIVYLFLCRFLLLSISRKLAGLLLLGAFAWKWEVPISLVISVRLSFRMCQRGCYWTDIREMLSMRIFTKICGETPN